MAQITLSNLAVRLLSLLSMPLLTHLLPPSAYGTAAMAGTLMSLAAVIALAGIDVSYVRAFHSPEFPSSQAVENFVWRYALGSGMLIALTVIVLRDPLSQSLTLPLHVSWLVAVGIILNISQTMAQTRSRLNGCYGAVAVANFAAGVLSIAIGTGLAYWWRRDELPLILSMIAGFLISILVLRSPPASKLAKASGLSSAQRLNILNIGLAALVTAPAYWVITSSDRWFLAYFKDIHTIGIYSVGYSVAIVGMIANNAMLVVWTPEAVRIYESHSSSGVVLLSRMTEDIITCLALVCLAVIAAGGDIVKLLSAPTFHPSAMVVPFIALAVFFYGVAQLANTAFVLARQFPRTIWWWILGAVGCFVSNAVLIPKFGMLGAALSQLCGFFIIALGLLVKARQQHLLELNWLRLSSNLVAIIVPTLFMFQSWSESPLHSLLMKFPFCATVAVFIGWRVGLVSRQPGLGKVGRP